jgi:hypothetical protein
MILSEQRPHEYMNTCFFCGNLEMRESNRSDPFAGELRFEVDTQLGRAVICLPLFVLGYETITDDFVPVLYQKRGIGRVRDIEKFFQIFFGEFLAMKGCS